MYGDNYYTDMHKAYYSSSKIIISSDTTEVMKCVYVYVLYLNST